jgi:hypothetical protein
MGHDGQASLFPNLALKHLRNVHKDVTSMICGIPDSVGKEFITIYYAQCSEYADMIRAFLWHKVLFLPRCAKDSKSTAARN